MPADSTIYEQPPAERGSLGLSLIVGIALGVPGGWLLAYLVALPAFLGLFFYLLIGLLIGATMYRLGKRAAPVSRVRLWRVGIVVALVIWLSGLIMEYRGLADDVARSVIHSSVTQSMSSQELKEFEGHTRENVFEQLSANYPPGGFLGYMRWRATSATLTIARPGNQGPYVFHPLLRRPTLWIARLALSLVLVSFSVVSQLYGLAPAKAAAESAATRGGE